MHMAVVDQIDSILVQQRLQDLTEAATPPKTQHSSSLAQGLTRGGGWA